MKRHLSDLEIDSYQKQGAILIKNIFNPWIDLLRTGFEKVLKEPGPHSRENVNNGEGRFFEDYCNWQRVSEFKKFAEESPAAQIVAEATRSKTIQLFHEHIFIKDPGTNKETPWHQDMPYYCVDGNDTGSFWIPLDTITKNNSLKILLGSHKLPKLIRPTKWSNNQPWYSNDNNFMDIPDIAKMEKNIKSLGIPTFSIKVRTISDIFESINRLGKELNCQEAAKKLLFLLKDKINTFKQRLAGRLPKKVLLLLGDSSNPARDLYAVGPGTFLNELLVLSGGKNILKNSKAQYPKLSKEFIIEQSPEIIIEAGPKSDLPQKEIDYRVGQWNRFPTIRAVRDKRIYFIGADYILIPGPRLVKILENFVQVIHPDLSNSQIGKITFQETVKP